MPDGYHRIETLFAFAAEGDLLCVDASDDLSLRIIGPFASALDDGADNLVVRAARALRDGFGVTAGANLVLEKRLPIAAGIGGGSADAAAALRLLVRHWKLPPAPERVEAIARSLGADVPACVASVPVRGDGRGDLLTPIDAASLTGLPLLLVNPGIPLSTGPVFAAWDGIDRGTLEAGGPLSIARAGRNDLEAPAISLCPAIGALLRWLESRAGAELVRMSGSGATCFALFDTAANLHLAGRAARSAFPDAWCLATTLR